MLLLTVLFIVALVLLVFLAYKEYTRVPEEEEVVEIRWTAAGKVRPGDGLMKR